MNPKDHKLIKFALQKLRPGAQFSISGTDIEWLDEQHTQPTWAEIEATIPEVKSERRARQQERARQRGMHQAGITTEAKVAALWDAVANDDDTKLNELKALITQHGGE